jgi:hypothetical protein
MVGNNLMSIKGASVHFIYSLLPVTTNGDEEADLVLHAESIRNFYSAVRQIPGARARAGLPSDRRGISPFLDLNLDMGYVQFPKCEGAIGGLALSATLLLRVFPLGSACCVKVRVRKRNGAMLAPEDIQRVLGTVRRKHGDRRSPRIFKTPDGPKSVYELFWHSCEALQERANKQAVARGGRQRGKIELLCKRHLHNTLNSEPQTPWIVTVLELAGPAHDAFCGTFSHAGRKYGITPAMAKDRAIAEYEDQIAPLLFHAVRPSFHVEPMYMRPPYPGAIPGPYSLNVEAEMFVAMSRRSVLCLCGNARRKDGAASYFLPTLLDLCEITRARWQGLIVLNKMLDESLGNFRLNNRRMRPIEARRRRLRQIVSLSDRFSSSQNDPGAYVCSGDALRDIHERLSDIFKISELSKAVQQKLDALERLYRHGLELAWAERR